MATTKPIVCVVDFHHARGPEVETWIGIAEGEGPALETAWPLLPFMALSDGAHAATEDFSYFTVRRDATPTAPATSLFGIACTRQLDARELIDRPAEVTRSTVQKAVVVITETPQHFGSLREKLAFITKAWFAQRDFTDLEILRSFQESIAATSEQEEERDQFFGSSLREIIREWKWQTLVMLKCMLLQPKMLFFGSHCEKICMLQFSLVSLIPGLIRNLQDAADPSFNRYEETFVPPTSLRTSERASLLAYVGLPLQLFGKGSFFGPYTPLQQLDLLTEDDTKSYVIGSTNALLLSQKERYCDVLINLDDTTITIDSQPLKTALALTTPDRRWIDFLTQTVNDTWDEQNPSRPKTMGYAGSEEFIRLQFEEYLLAMLSTVKYKQYLECITNEPKSLLADVEGNPASEFGLEWIKAWQKTESYRIFNRFADSHIFDVVEPHHPCTGGLTIDDVQRRLATQVAELHLDERLQAGKETLNKHIATGQKKVSTAFNTLWNDIEVMREGQRQKAAEQRAAAVAANFKKSEEAGMSGEIGDPQTRPVESQSKSKAPDLSQAQANIQAAGAKAGAYLSSWGTWAAEKRKTGWGGSKSTATTTAPTNQPAPGSWAPTLGSKPAPTPQPAPGGWAPTLGSKAYEDEKEKRRSMAFSSSRLENKRVVSQGSSASGRSRPQSMVSAVGDSKPVVTPKAAESESAPVATTVAGPAPAAAGEVLDKTVEDVSHKPAEGVSEDTADS